MDAATGPPRETRFPVIELCCPSKSKQKHSVLKWFAAVILVALGAGAETLTPVPAQADTKVIPTAVLSERYDTNVFYAPPELLPPGQRRSDFVSNLVVGSNCSISLGLSRQASPQAEMPMPTRTTPA